MSHPEIPKDHERFVNGYYWVAPRRYELFADLAGYQRQDCAAHAAAWWYRLSTSAVLDCDEITEAMEIAEAWLKWGSQ